MLDTGCSIADQTLRLVAINKIRQALAVMQLLVQTPGLYGVEALGTQRHSEHAYELYICWQVAREGHIPPRLLWPPLVHTRRHPHMHVARVCQPKEASLLQSQSALDELQESSCRRQVLASRVIHFVVGRPWTVTHHTTLEVY